MLHTIVCLVNGMRFKLNGIIQICTYIFKIHVEVQRIKVVEIGRPYGAKRFAVRPQLGLVMCLIKRDASLVVVYHERLYFSIRVH